jgi:hypothetical protein
MKLWCVAALALLANGADLATTYAATPSLSAEYNALSRYFGLGWPGLIAAKLCGIALAVAGYAYYLRRRAECYPPAGLDCAAFRRHMAGAGSRIAQGFPHLGVKVGYLFAGMQLFIVWAAAENWLLGRGICVPLRRVSETGYHLLQGGVTAWLVMARFYASNYRRYCAGGPAERCAPLRAAASSRQA